MDSASLTEKSAKSVAVSVEETYAVVREESDGWNIDGTDWVETYVQSFDNGYFVKVTVSIDAHKSTQVGTGTEQKLYGSFSYKGWYRITNKKIERAPAQSGETPPESGWTTVACA